MCLLLLEELVSIEDISTACRLSELWFFISGTGGSSEDLLTATSDYLFALRHYKLF
jgi:hypothetical protein